MFIALLGRHPNLSIAELQAMFGRSAVTQRTAQMALVKTDCMDITELGGTVKCGVVLGELPAGRNDKASLIAATKWLERAYPARVEGVDGKLTLGISVYGLSVTARDVQKTGLLLKSVMKRRGLSVRLIPNTEPALSTAAAHNNKLGLSPKRREVLIVTTGDERIIIAESRGAQNITAYAKRDRQRPRRDAFVGMLPPKLAQMMVNLAVGAERYAEGAATVSSFTASHRASADARAADCSESCVATPSAEPVTQQRILDPFCGTGTVLQEALLRGCVVSGSDLSPKMIDYTRQNLAWLRATHHTTGEIRYLQPGDATTLQWPTPHSIDAVVCETYLGQPFSAPPAAAKLAEVTTHCSHIISRFLANLRPQLAPGTPLCIAVPAWADQQDRLTQLPLIKQLDALGYHVTHAAPLIYRRPGQVVARQLLMLRSA